MYMVKNLILLEKKNKWIFNFVNKSNDETEIIYITYERDTYETIASNIKQNGIQYENILFLLNILNNEYFKLTQSSSKIYLQLDTPDNKNNIRMLMNFLGNINVCNNFNILINHRNDIILDTTLLNANMLNMNTNQNLNFYTRRTFDKIYGKYFTGEYRDIDYIDDILNNGVENNGILKFDSSKIYKNIYKNDYAICGLSSKNRITCGGYKTYGGLKNDLITNVKNIIVKPKNFISIDKQNTVHIWGHNEETLYRVKSIFNILNYLIIQKGENTYYLLDKDGDLKKCKLINNSSNSDGKELIKHIKSSKVVDVKSIIKQIIINKLLAKF